MKRQRVAVGRIYGDVTFEQEIFSFFDRLTAIEITPATYRRELSGLLVSDLLDDQGNVLATSTHDLSEITDNSPYAIWFPPVANTRGRILTLRLSAPSLSAETPVTFWSYIPDREPMMPLRCRLEGKTLLGGLCRRQFYATLAGAAWTRLHHMASMKIVEGAVEEPILVRSVDAMRRRLLGTTEPGSLDRVLEIGCGLGDMARSLAPQVHSYHGMEDNPGVRDLAQERLAGMPGCELGPLDLDALRKRDDGSVDLVLHHPCSMSWSAAEQVTWLREIRRLLSPAGTLIVDSTDWRDVTSFRLAMGIDPRIRYNDLVPMPTPLKRFLAQIECVDLRVERVEARGDHFAVVCVRSDLYNFARVAAPGSTL